MPRELIFENLPVQLNLGDHDVNNLGWATAWVAENGETHMDIRLSPEASAKLGDLTKVFELRAIGFAGMARGDGWVRSSSTE